MAKAIEAESTGLTRWGHVLQLAISAISVNSRDFADFNSNAFAERLLSRRREAEVAMRSELGSRREKD